MDFSFSAEAETFRQEIRQFLKDEPPHNFLCENPDDAQGNGAWSFALSRRLGE